MTKKPSMFASIFIRIFRSIFSIAILTALVLGIIFLVKQLAEFDINKATKVSTTVARKIGIDEDQIGQVAGVFTENIEKFTDVIPNTSSTANSKVLYRVGIFADIENDFDGFEVALSEIKKEKPSFIILLGDLTSWGDYKSLYELKNILDTSNLTYYVIPGDHDLANASSDGDNSGLKYFREVFGLDYHTAVLGDSKFVIVNNAANYTLMSSEVEEFLLTNIPDADFVFLSQPLYSTFLPRSMGVIDGEITPDVRAQAERLLDNIRNTEVNGIISGDHHISSKAIDPVRENLTHYVIGAVTEEPNLQTPRFSVLELLEDGTYNYREVEINQ